VNNYYFTYLIVLLLTIWFIAAVLCLFFAGKFEIGCKYIRNIAFNLNNVISVRLTRVWDKIQYPDLSVYKVFVIKLFLVV
jgi:hypothetical protein